jgi:hypothetical protein
MAKGPIEKLSRLRHMSAVEARYRLREQLRSQWDRMRFHFRMNGMSDRDLLSLFQASSRPDWDDKGSRLQNGFSLKGYLQEKTAPRFYLPADDPGREKLVRLIARDFPEWIEQAVDDAERICEHVVGLLGHGEIYLGREIDWHRDPVTGTGWPRRFWADYDLVHSRDPEDPKIIHELNRQQHLPRLAKAFLLTGEERYAREAIAQMQSWIDQNPQGLGINWHCSLEIALRVISWLWTLFFLLPSPSLDEAAARRLVKSLLAQLDQIYRYPSRFSSPNTHLLGEATALFIGGLLFQELEPAAAWLRQGVSLLETEMERQVSADGVHAELSSYYHCYALDFYLQSVALAQRNGFPIPHSLSGRLCQMVEFLMHFMLPDGSIPLLGDDDGGRALALRSSDYRSFPDALCTGAVLFRRQDFKHQAGSFSEETLWLLGGDACRAYALIESMPPDTPGRSYVDAGYFIQRSGWEELDSHLIFDCGGLGAPTGGHGHADALSLVLSAGGKELLVDPGTFVYNCAPEWRNFFRSTRAHNTVVIDDSEQSQAGGTFSWEQKAIGKLLKHFSLQNLEYVEAVHSGYTRLRQSVIHGRALLFNRPEYWVVLDNFQGLGEHNFDFYYHFSPQSQLALYPQSDPSVLRAVANCEGAGLQLFMLAGHPLTGEVISGRISPAQGWVSTRYGERRPAPTLRAHFSSTVPSAAVCFLIPFTAAAEANWEQAMHAPFRNLGMSSLSPIKSEGAIACMLACGRWQDIVVFSREDSEAKVLDFRLRGELFWLRTSNGVLEKLLAINARSVAHQGKVIFDSRDSLPYISVRFSGNELIIEPKEVREKVCAEFAA